MLHDTVVIEGEVSLINQIDGDPDVVIAEGGGIVPTGTIEITSNGVYNITEYASADVDVQGGVTPTGTKSISITQNGVTTEDVTNYASAEITTAVPASAVDSGTKSISANGTHDVIGYASASVNVPNSYSASDEGKVVSNGALVSQTSDTVTANDTYDTTLINSLTVNVSGSSGFTLDLTSDYWEVGAVTGTPGSTYQARKQDNTARLRGINLFQTFNLPYTFKMNWANEWQAQYAFYGADGLGKTQFTVMTEDTDIPTTYPYIAIVLRHIDGTTAMNVSDVNIMQPKLELDVEALAILLNGE